MQKGDLVTQKNYKGSIGVLKHRCTWSKNKGENIWAVYWFNHLYDTGEVSPVYEWEVRVVKKCP